MFSVLIAIGIDQQPNMHAYWAMDVFNYTLWYHEQFPRDQFDVLYSPMLCINSFEKKKSTKNKIKPFLNLLG